MKAIILSLSSDIGTALAYDWITKGWTVFGTYRRLTPQIKAVPAQLFHCDLSDEESVSKATQSLIEACPEWDVLVLAAGDLEPIGNFQDVNFRRWEMGIQINLLKPLQMLHALLPYRNRTKSKPPCVIFFAGGGTNNAVLHYSSYTLSKIALIKMCELLDAEIPDTRFVIIGPGVVKTKIHEPTLRQDPQSSSQSDLRILERLARGECTPMEHVVDCCTWAATSKSPSFGGRNFSTASDEWGSLELEKELESDPNMYKLRRYKNSWKSHQNISDFEVIKSEPSL